MNALPVKKTRKRKEAAGRKLQKHDFLLFGSTGKGPWKSGEKIKPQ